MLIGGIIVFVVGGLMVFMGKRQKSTQQEMSKTSVIPVKDIQEGAPVEVYGKVIAEQPLLTPFTKRECVYYEYTLERENQTRTTQGNTSRTWDQIASDNQRTHFWIQDASGKIEVNPDRADMDPQDLGEQYVQQAQLQGNSLFANVLNMIGSGVNSRARERALLTNANAYVYGQVVKGANGLVIEKGNGKFVISHRTESEIEKRKGRSAMMWTVIGIIALIVGIVLAVKSFI